MTNHGTVAPNAARFPELAPDRAAPWTRFLRPDRVLFPTFAGIVVEEVRTGYARLRLPARPEVSQVAGLLHGGAIATLLDTAAIPAVGTAYPEQPDMVTVSLNIDFCGAVRDEDAVAEAWVTRATSTLAFVAAEARGARTGDLAATSSSVFRVRARTR
jgi:uncharacterized protein (TIGR00369 family)